MTAIGIDLGTTYSCVINRAPDGTDTVVTAFDGGELTPSVVYFGADEVLVGAEAKRMLGEDPDNVVVGIKRHMGREHPLEFGGTVYTPEAISALILRRLAQDAAAELATDTAALQAVITVPAYFGVAEKEATIAAARIAGLPCLELLAEPVAAGYAYGLSADSMATSLVFDLGGGTFDVAVIGSHRGVPRIWAVDGETRLGGLDWDAQIEEHVWEALGDDADDLRYDEDFFGAVAGEAERAKRELTVKDSVTVRLRYRSQKWQVTVTRDWFERSTRHLVDRCLDAARRVVASAGALGAPTVDQVLLVGGSTRMPMIKDALTREFMVPVLINDPDRAVARGAAVLAAQLTAAPHRLGAVDAGPRIVPVVPRGIGVLVHSSMEPWRPDPYVKNLIAANTPLPIAAKEFAVATVLDNQETARIQLFEQGGAVVSEALQDNRLVFDGEVTGLPKASGGGRIAILVSMGVDGRVSAEARDARGRPLPMEAFIDGVLDEAEIEDQTRAVGKLRLSS